MVWTEENIERALRAASPDGERFPTTVQLRKAGLGSLYEHLRRRGELDAWATRLALTRRRRRWTEDDIEQALRSLSADLPRFPTAKQFREAGRQGLYTVLHERGELDMWAQRLGLERRRRWNNETIAAALTELSAGETRFPNVAQFRAAGLSGLYSALERRGELDAWAQRLGLPRRHVDDPQRWDDAAIAAALEQLCAGRDSFPTGREFREAGMYGLYAALRRRDELDVWSQRLGLPRRSHQRPNRHGGTPRHPAR